MLMNKLKAAVFTLAGVAGLAGAGLAVQDQHAGDRASRHMASTESFVLDRASRHTASTESLVLSTPLDEDPLPRQFIDVMLAELPRTPSFSPVAAPSADKLPFFLRRKLAAYQPDAEQTPFRDKVRLAIAVLDRQSPRLRQDWRAELNQLKKDARVLQSQLSPDVLELDEQLEEMADAEVDLANEKSAHWRALYLHVWAKLFERKAMLFEYNWMLGAIRTDSLPDGHGWQLVFQEELTARGNERREAEYALGKSRRLLERIVKEHPDTPYALLATRDIKCRSRGMRWQSVE